MFSKIVAGAILGTIAIPIIAFHSFTSLKHSEQGRRDSATKNAADYREYKLKLVTRARA